MVRKESVIEIVDVKSEADREKSNGDQAKRWAVVKVVCVPLWAVHEKLP